MSRVGILAYGSLINDPGQELCPLVSERICGVETPFCVEFARSSTTRDGAPTLVPVEQGGCNVQAVILVLDTSTTVERAKDLLWRRETRNEASSKHYNPQAIPNSSRVCIKRLDNFHGVEIVLYTYIKDNISVETRTPQHLACLAIRSARNQSGADENDGISYLVSVKKARIVTPLMANYEAAILRKTGATTLDEALEKVRQHGT